MKIKEMPTMERPYEKLEVYGASKLSMAELLAIIIKSGTKDETSLEIAQRLMSLSESDDIISFINDKSIEELTKIKGIGRVKAIMLKSVAEISRRAELPLNIFKRKVSCPEEAAKLFMAELKNEKQEIIKTILLDDKCRVLKILTNSIGGINSNAIELRELFIEPIKCGAYSIIVAHNHPNGDVTPSMEDINFTKKVSDTGKLLGITLQDHLIIGNGVFSSLKRLKKF